MTLLLRTAPESAGMSARLPSFLVIGATKCGTTSLHDWLSRHPDVFMSPWKEMRFFLPGYRWERGIDWYARQFAGAGSRSAVGEASNGYGRGAEHEGVPLRVARHLPEVRLIYMIRDPMARLVSHYRHRLATGREWRDPDAAIAADPGYVATGCYGAELARWHAVFPAERILVLRSETLFAAPERELARVAAHLGVAARPDLPFRRENGAARRSALPRGLRRAIGATRLWGAGRLLGHAARDMPGLRKLDDIPVRLSRETRTRLRDVYDADRAHLRRFVPACDCDWSLA